MPGAGSADISDLKMTDTTPGLTEKAAEYLPPRNLIGGLHVYNTSQSNFVGMVDGYVTNPSAVWSRSDEIVDFD